MSFQIHGDPNSPTLQHMSGGQATPTVFAAPAPAPAAAPAAAPARDPLPLAQSNALLPQISEINSANRLADLLLRLSVAMGQAGMGKQACDDYSNTLSRMADGYKPDLGDVDALRQALTTVVSCLERKLHASVLQEDGRPANYVLNLGDFSLLRAASLLDARQWERESRLEYMPHARGVEGRRSCSTLCYLSANPALSGDGILEEKKAETDMEAYATGMKCMENNEAGNAKLHRLSQQSDEELLDVLSRARPNVAQFLHVFMIPSVLDGQRMRATNAIYSRYLDELRTNPCVLFGGVQDVAKAADTSESGRESKRICKAACVIVVMGREGLIAERGQDVAERSPAWKRLDVLLLLLISVWEARGEQKQRVSPRSVNGQFLATIAEWMEESLRREDGIAAIRAAMTAKVFSPSATMGAQAQDTYKAFYGVDERGPVRTHTMWDAASFLVSARLQMHDTVGGGNTVVAAMAVFTGAVLNTCQRKVDGPFIMSKETRDAVKIHFAKFEDMERLPKNRPVASKSTSETACTVQQLAAGTFNRSQHKKGPGHETRLSASLFTASITESILNDVAGSMPGIPEAKEGATAALSEGRKDLRRIYVASLQVYPSVKVVSSGVSGMLHMVQMAPGNEEPSSYTTAANVESAWRCIVGGSFFNTLLYPATGPCYTSACAVLANEDKPTTVECVDLFIEHSRARAANLMGKSRWAFKDGPQTEQSVEQDRAEKMLKQQHSLIHHVCNVCRGSGMIWSDLKQIFKNYKKDDDDDDDGEYDAHWCEPFRAGSRKRVRR